MALRISPPLALARVQLGQGSFDPTRFAEQHEGLQHVRPHRRGESMRCDQRLGQLPGGAESGDRGGVRPARHFEAPRG
jgi:hypothetical protein